TYERMCPGDSAGQPSTRPTCSCSPSSRCPRPGGCPDCPTPCRESRYIAPAFPGNGKCWRAQRSASGSDCGSHSCRDTEWDRDKALHSMVRDREESPERTTAAQIAPEAVHLRVKNPRLQEPQVAVSGADRDHSSLLLLFSSAT